MKIFWLTILFLLFLVSEVISQSESKKLEIGGYVSNMLSYNYIPKGYASLLGLDASKSQWISNHYLQNRLNFFVYPAKNLKGSLQLRNRFFYGDYIDLIPGYSETLEMDNGIIDLSGNVIDQNNYALNMAIDRLWLQYTIGKLDIKAGRQRINWSQTFAFNPNDIFNTYSFFEVDYPERPGTDAFRFSYYPGYTSTIEAVVSLDSSNQISAAVLYRFNKWSYDFQFITGILSEQDIVFGAGWSGNIEGAGFRGEASYFRPKKNFGDTTGIFVASVSFDYMFSNSLYIQLEGLYNQMQNDDVNFLQVFNQPLTPKTLSFTEYTILTQSSYPITPLWNSSLSVIYYPKMDAIFFGPSLEYLALDNLSVSVFWQTFYGDLPNPITQTNENKAFNFGYFRVKYNF